MRRFTKEHNDINWLFPPITKYSNPEQAFKQFEQMGQDLLEQGYGTEQTVFTRDDMMDAFMKGASVMNKILYEKVTMSTKMNNNWQEIQKNKQIIDKVMNEIEKLK